jgi:predicted RND superfamily exporter protein
MTTAAMIFGMLPLSLGITEGARERASMGTVLIGGLLSSLVLTLVLVPVIYTYVMEWADRRAAKRAAKRAGNVEDDALDPQGMPSFPLPAGAQLRDRASLSERGTL